MEPLAAPEPELRAAVGRAFRRLSWPVAIVAFDDEVGARGMTVSSVTSLSLDPPSVVICINRVSTTFRAVRRGRRFGLSLLAAGQQGLGERLSIRGGNKSLLPEELVRIGPSGYPVVRGAAATFGIDIQRVVPAYSHVVVVATVAAVRLPDREVVALAYRDGHFEPAT